MLKWFIIGTLLYYAIFLWRYRDSLETWFTGRKKQPEQPESKPTVKTGNRDSLVGASRYRMGQMRTNEDILGHLLKGVDNASIFVPQSMKRWKKHLIINRWKMKIPIPYKRLIPNLKWNLKRKTCKKRTFRRMKSKRKKSPVTWGTVSRKWHRVSHWVNWGKWYRSFRLSKRPTRKNGKQCRPSAGRKQTSFIRWWNRLTGAGHGWRNFYKSMIYPYPPLFRLPEIMKWQPLT